MAWYAEFRDIIQSEESAEDFLKSKGILGTRAPTCPEDGCGRTMSRLRKQDRFVWRCPSHKNRNISCRAGTFLERQKMSNLQFLLICNAWADMETIEKAEEKTGLSEKTVLHWYQHFRDVCSRQLLSAKEKIGGNGLTVEVDGSVIVRRKFQGGKTVDERRVFGGICAETGQMFMSQVENLDEQTLLPILEANVAGGSIVHSKGLAVYSGIAALPANPPFQHRVAFDRFRKPEGGACLTRVQRMWCGVRAKLNRINDCCSSTLPSHLDEAMWRHKYLGKGKRPFHTILDHVAELYPV